MNGDRDRERRALPGDAADDKLAAMSLDDAVRDGKTQTGSFTHRLRRKKWIENLLQIPGIDSAAGIADGRHHISFVAARFYQDFALRTANVLRCIYQQVHPNLVHLGGIAFDLGQLPMITFQVDVTSSVVARSQSHSSFDCIM